MKFHLKGGEFMGKHRVPWTAEVYRRRIKEGRGQGEGKDYKPWLTIQDVPSKGVCSRVLGKKTGRIHHFLSRNETAYFQILDASDHVLDIREQFPLLDVLDAVEIADKAGIRYPRDPVSKYPYVLTSDFVISTDRGPVVRTVKMVQELSKKRTREKLEIERRFWKAKGIDWNIVTDDQIDFQKARNLEWVYRSLHYIDMLPEGRSHEEVSKYFLNLYQNTHWPISEIASKTEEHFRLEPGLGLTTFQYLIRVKQIRVDLSCPLDLVSARIERKGGTGLWLPAFA